MSLEKVSNILLVVFAALVGGYFVFQDRPFMEPVHSHLQQGGPDRTALYIVAAVVLLVLPQMIQSITRKARDIISTVRSVTDHGVEGWAHVRKVYRTQQKMGKGDLYFFDLDVSDSDGNEYSITILHPVRRKDLGFFIPGSRIPVKTARRDRSMMIFPQLDYRSLGSFLFMGENSDDWAEALKTKEEITLTPVGSVPEY
jgi:hypothetical protein